MLPVPCILLLPGALTVKGLGLDDIAAKAGQIIGIDPDLIRFRARQPKVVQARSLSCQWATHELGILPSGLSKRLRLSPSEVGPAADSTAMPAEQLTSSTLEIRLDLLILKHFQNRIQRSSGHGKAQRPGRP